ncbi:P-type conjugative transfer protein TrbL, partial [Rhodoligotrophos defluvii]|uniref:P-type conjugative transfer protein TrbL n=1 Tax=Rhodoligotrophos defluvii TaxID=2561934 RepID=UPI0010C98A0D
MDDINVIDRFTQTFITYIDSGFGLLTGDVAFLTSILVAIDITLAGLWWAMDEGSNVVARLVRKVLYVGAFALILNNWQLFADVVFQSFSGLGLKATPTGLTADRLLQPGFVAGTGFEAAYPLLQQAGDLLGFTTFFDNAVTILVLVFAWLVVVLAFFILAVQLFITIIEFKLTTLAGFVLVPFALWNKTAFLAERVLGNVISSGIKVMVLAVIIGIGTTLFGDFISALDGAEPNLEQAMSLVLASIALFGLGIFGPGIAAGLVSGAPQLGAGAAIGTAGAVAAGTLAGGAAALGVARTG